MRLVLAAALGLLSLAASGSPADGVQTLYRSETGPITAFAQNGSAVAWFAPGRGRCNAVHVLSLSGVSVKVTLPAPGTSNVTCRWDVGDGPVRLALADSSGDVSALWILHEHGPVDFDYVVGADAHEPLERRFYQLAHTRRGAGLWLGGIAGDGQTLVYSVATVAYVDQLSCLSGGSCRLRLLGGGIRRVVGRSNPLLPGTGAALDVAVGGGRLAYIPAAGVGKDGRPVASASKPVEVRDATTGALVSQIRPRGVPLGLALSPTLVAVLARRAGHLSLTWYDPGDGAALGSIAAPPGTSPQIAAADRLVVYRIGRVVRGVEVATGTVRTLVTTAATPIDLSLDGDRLAWAENLHGKGRIRVLVLSDAG